MSWLRRFAVAGALVVTILGFDGTVMSVPTAMAATTQADHSRTDRVVEDPAYAAEGARLGKEAAASLVGQPAPAITMTTIDGAQIDLAKIYGKKPVYLKFWATWCVPCRQQMPGFEHIYETMGNQIQVVAVDIGFNDDLAAVRAYRQQMGLHMPIVMDDGSLGALFNLRVTPQHVLIGRDGRIAYVGHLADQPLDAALQGVLSAPRGHTVVKALYRPSQPVFKPGEIVRGLQARTNSGARVVLGRGHAGRLQGVVFFSTWCESYLATSRPAAAQACRRVREQVDRLAASGSVDWIGIAGGPWSTAADLADYQATTKTKIPLALDTSGKLFRSFGVREIPTIALIDGSGRLVRLIGPNDADIQGAIREVRMSRAQSPGRK